MRLRVKKAMPERGGTDDIKEKNHGTLIDKGHKANIAAIYLT